MAVCVRNTFLPHNDDFILFVECFVPFPTFAVTSVTMRKSSCGQKHCIDTDAPNARYVDHIWRIRDLRFACFGEFAIVALHLQKYLAQNNVIKEYKHCSTSFRGTELTKFREIGFSTF